jgi:hypothetical protein
MDSSFRLQFAVTVLDCMGGAIRTKKTTTTTKKKKKGFASSSRHHHTHRTKPDRSCPCGNSQSVRCLIFLPVQRRLYLPAVFFLASADSLLLLPPPTFALALGYGLLGYVLFSATPPLLCRVCWPAGRMLCLVSFWGFGIASFCLGVVVVVVVVGRSPTSNIQQQATNNQHQYTCVVLLLLLLALL